MDESDPGWLSEFRPPLREPLRRAAGGLPPNVALMQLLIACATPAEAQGALLHAGRILRGRDELATASRIEAVLELFRANPGAFGLVRSVIARADHAPAESGDAADRDWAAVFDSLAGAHPEASVALYALGNPELLEAATQEIVELLAEWKLIAADTECLDLGCGIGRLEPALAARVRRVLALDVSAAMVAETRRRTAHLPNVEVRQAAGRDLAGVPEKSFDLVIASDVFPYIVRSGTDRAAAMLSEAARVLRPGGRLLILNFSYRSDPEADRNDVARLAVGCGFSVERNGVAPFRFWDALAFELAMAP
jgi:SAM-dependent methyltransferase